MLESSLHIDKTVPGRSQTRSTVRLVPGRSPYLHDYAEWLQRRREEAHLAVSAAAGRGQCRGKRSDCTVQDVRPVHACAQQLQRGGPTQPPPGAATPRSERQAKIAISHPEANVAVGMIGGVNGTARSTEEGEFSLRAMWHAHVPGNGVGTDVAALKKVCSQLLAEVEANDASGGSVLGEHVSREEASVTGQDRRCRHVVGGPTHGLDTHIQHNLGPQVGHPTNVGRLSAKLTRCPDPHMSSALRTQDHLDGSLTTAHPFESPRMMPREEPHNMPTIKEAGDPHIVQEQIVAGTRIQLLSDGSEAIHLSSNAVALHAGSRAHRQMTQAVAELVAQGGAEALRSCEVTKILAGEHGRRQQKEHAAFLQLRTVCLDLATRQTHCHPIVGSMNKIAQDLQKASLKQMTPARYPQGQHVNVQASARVSSPSTLGSDRSPQTRVGRGGHASLALRLRSASAGPVACFHSCGRQRVSEGFQGKGVDDRHVGDGARGGGLPEVIDLWDNGITWTSL
jgi:hypothetical protein